MSQHAWDDTHSTPTKRQLTFRDDLKQWTYKGMPVSVVPFAWCDECARWYESECFQEHQCPGRD